MSKLLEVIQREKAARMTAAEIEKKRIEDKNKYLNSLLQDTYVLVCEEIGKPLQASGLEVHYTASDWRFSVSKPGHSHAPLVRIKVRREWGETKYDDESRPDKYDDIFVHAELASRQLSANEDKLDKFIEELGVELAKVL